MNMISWIPSHIAKTLVSMTNRGRSDELWFLWCSDISQALIRFCSDVASLRLKTVDLICRCLTCEALFVGNRWTDISLITSIYLALTHRGRMRHICVSKVGPQRFRYCLNACLAPSHYLHQRWFIVNRAIGNKSWWNVNRSMTILTRNWVW